MCRWDVREMMQGRVDRPAILMPLGWASLRIASKEIPNRILAKVKFLCQRLIRIRRLRVGDEEPLSL